MHSYIAIQNTYEVFEMALFINNVLHDQVREDKRHTSKLLIPLLDQLLTRNTITIADLSFCVVNCGPGPFSTLRSIIASVNGLHCAIQIPLVGIDGLHATFLEFYDTSYEHTVVLLNAFNDEVYYLIAHHEQVISTGYKKINLFLEEISHSILYEKINFFGNGVTLHKDQIKTTLGEKAILNHDGKNMCSLEYIGTMGLEIFEKDSYTADYLMPLHLKKHPVELL